MRDEFRVIIRVALVEKAAGQIRQNFDAERMAQLDEFFQALFVMRRVFIDAHHAQGIVPFLMDLNQPDAVFRKLLYPIIIVFRWPDGHLIQIFAEVVDGLARNIVADMQFPEAALDGSARILDVVDSFSVKLGGINHVFPPFGVPETHCIDTLL